MTIQRIAAGLGSFLILLAGVAAGSTLEMRADNTRPKVGDTIAVTVHLNDASPLSSWQNSLKFDSAKLRHVSARGGTFGTFAADARSAADINALEKETEGLLAEIIWGSET